MLSSVIRYSSGMSDAGPNDMQIIWFNAIGTTEESLSEGRLIWAAMRVFSRGELSLRSADPRDDPNVEFRMLTDDRDRVRMRDVVRRLLAITRHRAVVSISDSVLAGTAPIDTLDGVTFDEVVEVARGISEELAVACVGPHAAADF